MGIEKCVKRFRSFEEKSQEPPPLTSVIQSDPISTELELEERFELKQDENSFQCNQCFHKFSNLDQLQQHTTSAHLDTKHPCVDCEYKGTTKSNLEMHIQKVHAQF